MSWRIEEEGARSPQYFVQSVSRFFVTWAELAADAFDEAGLGSLKKASSAALTLQFVAFSSRCASVALIESSHTP